MKAVLCLFGFLGLVWVSVNYSNPCGSVDIFKRIKLKLFLKPRPLHISEVEDEEKESTTVNALYPVASSTHPKTVMAIPQYVPLIDDFIITKTDINMTAIRMEIQKVRLQLRTMKTVTYDFKRSHLCIPENYVSILSYYAFF